jgi:hypothetical protein
LVAYRIFIAPYWQQDEFCMNVRQLQRHAIFTGKFTEICKFFATLRPVALNVSVAFINFMEFFMMKKTAIALGIAALACGAQAAEVFKNADTAIEVNADLQFYNVSLVEAADGQARNYIQGVGTQIQFKTSKVIDADLTVFGQIEFDPDPVGDNATVITDDMKFGLTSKTFGTIQMGQFDTFMEDDVMEIANSFDTTGTGLVTEPAAGNDGRHLAYKHKLGDFGFNVDYTSGYNAASSATDGTNGIALSATYTLGNLKLGVGSSTIARYKADSYSANSSKAAMGAGASYTLKSESGTTKFAFLTATNTSYSTTAADDGLDTSITHLSVHHTMGPWGLGVIGSTISYPTTSTKDSYTVQQSGIQVVYDLGKGAKLYGANSNKGVNGNKGNFTEFGFLMAF